MASSFEIADDRLDDHVDEEISTCLNLDNPKSFFLYAGAGSGKTRSLVKALDRLRESNGRRLRLYGRRVGVITYTNAACDEIKHRLDFDALVEVATIHSFVWSLIGGFHADIKQWLKTNLEEEIAELQARQHAGRHGTKAALGREKIMEAKQKRLVALQDVKRFTYNPNGENHRQNSLNHTEVIKIGAEFLMRRPLMQHILVNRFPIILIDESQDTNKLLMEAFLEVQRRQKHCFVLGLLGDTMQRIYGDGKQDLGQNVPSDWARPVKRMNHRCPPRIVDLINRIRSTVDDQKQKPRADKEQGLVRLFIVDSRMGDKPRVERDAAQRMAMAASDPLWTGANADVKTLILEHHMAAMRMGFLELYEPLYKVDRLRTALLDGTLPELRFFSRIVLPLVEAQKAGDEFTSAAIVRKNSPLLSKAILKTAGQDQPLQLRRAHEAVDSLLALWSAGEPRFLDVLQSLSQSNLFEIPEGLRPIAAINQNEQKKVNDDIQRMISETLADMPLIEESGKDPALDAWDKFLQTPFAQIKPYAEYVNGLAPFGTHQGVKGLQFPRVMIIIDDTDARGFLFHYEKLFGVKGKTATDLRNEQEGKETSIDRARRLFYVTCSRAERSLAIVAYSTHPEAIHSHVLHEDWFKAHEVEIFD